MLRAKKFQLKGIWLSTWLETCQLFADWRKNNIVPRVLSITKPHREGLSTTWGESCLALLCGPVILNICQRFCLTSASSLSELLSMSMRCWLRENFAYFSLQKIEFNSAPRARSSYCRGRHFQVLCQIV